MEINFSPFHLFTTVFVLVLSLFTFLAVAKQKKWGSLITFVFFNALVIYISFLVHEFGHILVMNTLGVGAESLNFSFGGLSVTPVRPYQGMPEIVAVFASGSVAGLIFAYLILGVVRLFWVDSWLARALAYFNLSLAFITFFPLFTDMTRVVWEIMGTDTLNPAASITVGALVGIFLFLASIFGAFRYMSKAIDHLIKGTR